MDRERQRNREKWTNKKLIDKYGFLQDVLTMDNFCLDNTFTIYNGTIIFFKKAVKHKNVEESNDREGRNRISEGISTLLLSYFREGYITNRKVFQLYFLYTGVVSNSNNKSDLGILQNR